MSPFTFFVVALDLTPDHYLTKGCTDKYQLPLLSWTLYIKHFPVASGSRYSAFHTVDAEALSSHWNVSVITQRVGSTVGFRPDL